MKIAVCVSGVFATKYKDDSLLYEYDQKLRQKFPQSDFYYATWTQFEERVNEVLPYVHCEFFEEPHMHYHPYLDIKDEDCISPLYAQTIEWVKQGGKKRTEWTLHHTKQILIHALLLETIPQEYDVYVKVRFDAYISNKASFDYYINQTYTDNIVFGFGTHNPKQFGSAINMTEAFSPLKRKYFLYDALIIHPNRATDTHQVKNLHKEGKLHAAEQGWCQVLSILPQLSIQNISGLVSNNKFGHPDEK